MALTDTQKLNARRHLGLPPVSLTPYDNLDGVLASFEDGGALETHLTGAITACDTALTALELARTDADELTEGGGAKFNYNTRISIKQDAYNRAVANLGRILSWPVPETDGAIIGISPL